MSAVGNQADCIADGVKVPGITSHLDAESRITGRAQRLAINSGIAFQGSTILGMGFTMTPNKHTG